VRQRDAIEMLADSGVGALGPTTWADLGCVTGTFTLALAGLLAPGSTIHPRYCRPGQYEIDELTNPRRRDFALTRRPRKMGSAFEPLS